MAIKRMTPNPIIDSGKFLRMSEKARLLWFYANNHADDEGVVDLYPELKKLEIISTGPIKELVENKFIIMLTGSDELIAYVNDFPKYNRLSDKKRNPSAHHELLEQMKLLARVETEDVSTNESNSQKDTDNE